MFQTTPSPTTGMDDSILSTGERRVAELLREGSSVEEIAERRGENPEVVRKAVDRVREKTGRAYATLAESPFTAEVATDLDDETRQRLMDALESTE